MHSNKDPTQPKINKCLFKKKKKKEPKSELPAGLGGSRGKVGGRSGSLWGWRHWWQWFWGLLIGKSAPGGHHFLTNTLPHQKACRLQCWDTAGWTTNRAGTQPHLSADRLPKIFLSPQLPTKSTPWHGPANQRDKTQLHRPTGRHQSLLPGSLHKPLRPASPTRGQTPEATGNTILQPVEMRLQTEKNKQNEMTKEYVPDEWRR